MAVSDFPGTEIFFMIIFNLIVKSVLNERAGRTYSSCAIQIKPPAVMMGHGCFSLVLLNFTRGTVPRSL